MSCLRKHNVVTQTTNTPLTSNLGPQILMNPGFPRGPLLPIRTTIASKITIAISDHDNHTDADVATTA